MKGIAFWWVYHFDEVSATYQSDEIISTLWNYDWRISMSFLYIILNYPTNVLLQYGLNDTHIILSSFVLYLRYSPIGIAFLIAGKIVEMEDFGVLLTQVGLYFLTVLIGLLIHGTLVLPGIFFLCTRRNPYKFIYGILQAMATAFGTSSR